MIVPRPPNATVGWRGQESGGHFMKMVAEYLEHALNFERMAAAENDPQLKANFETQAAAYRKLATARAKELGMEAPRGPQISN
jgi:hypothetical protein